MPARVLICHTRAHLDAALAVAERAGKEIVLLTPPGGTQYGGPAFYLEMLRQARASRPVARVRAILDCGTDAAMALFALDAGWREIALAGSAGARSKVADIARKHDDASVLARVPAAIDLAAEQDVVAACERSLNGR